MSDSNRPRVWRALTVISVLLSAFAGLSVPASAQAPVISYRIQSEWNPDFLITAERADPSVEVAAPNWDTADWGIKPVAGSNLVTLEVARRPREFTNGNYIPDMLTVRPGNPGPTLQMASDESGFSARVGQQWVKEPVSGRANVFRLKSQMTGLYLSMETGKLALSPTPANWFIYATPIKWAPQQCVKNMAGAVIRVEWFSSRDVTWRLQPLVKDATGALVNVMIPDGLPSQPALSQDMAISGSSCETNNRDLMVARVTLLYKDRVDNATAVTVGFIGSVPICLTGPQCLGVASVGGGLLLKELQKYPSLIYLGVPGQIEVTGSLYNAKIKVTAPVIK